MCASVSSLHLKLATNLLFQYKYNDDIVCGSTLRSIEEFVRLAGQRSMLRVNTRKLIKSIKMIGALFPQHS